MSSLYLSCDLLQSVIDAHGGREYWESIQSLAVEFEFSGAALANRGHPGPHDVKILVDTKSQKVTIEKFGPYYGSWSTERTEVARIGSQDPLDVRENPRAAFDSHTYESKWDAHNLIYFIGYAYWNYFNFPFHLQSSDIQIREVDGSTPENGEKWRTLEVVHSDGYPTHTKVQKFDFDARYRLRRMQYSVDVMKQGPPVWHTCYNHTVSGKYLYPTLRVVNVTVPDISFFSPFVLNHIKVEPQHS
ncbi:hypothetical protein M441DRAFT_183656 [Trichoderma asperellum CBS 433.97]|uniref:Uncharacterized protein n=1 Tax=Trichoderma asperellum (strain ATCC 204424 / CBS 433.97 / NBRC 101777) TaxID=1042311 RepID=A0A2T3ZJB1_TRIA4|nr:hypothetical protein M441DRAFT_183656 [Trichoderma asperellum CBS 433.97]PTB44886.1 hypothetical protein M441DRAFT_183656 [Trichoderma asperellum CBS 433.97]